MPEGGPYWATAVLCEKVLEEKDGVQSLIRVVDRITDLDQRPQLDTQFFLCPVAA